MPQRRTAVLPPTGTFLQAAVVLLAGLAGAAMVLRPAVAAPPPAGPQITGIGGYSDGVGIADGRWTGQPDSAPDTASNQFLGQLAVDTYLYPKGTRNPYYWRIEGQNFGAKEGRVVVARRPRDPSAVSVEVLSWSDTAIKVLATAPYGFTQEESFITVITAPTQRHRRGQMAPPREEDIVGMVKSRGYGQCTWFVAHTRIGAELDVPPTAYTVTASLPEVGAVASDYEPARWDCLVYGNHHVAIITSEPQGVRGRDGTITWTFTVEEMNCAWDEVASSSQRSYKLSAPDREGRRTVLTGIGTNASRRWVATGYYR